jgi:hypothetical protein
MPLQVARAGLVQPSAGELAALRAEYDVRHCVTLPRFIEPALRSWIHRRLAGAAWDRVVHADLDPPSVDLNLADPLVEGTIHALLQDANLFAAVRAITGCEAIGMYAFRLYRMDADAGHTDSWHGDNDGNRMATLSVNVGSEPFEGGGLQIREQATGRLVHRVHNIGPGDAILFRIDPALEHCVEEVRGPVSKYAIAGWFQKRPGAGLYRLVRR